MSYNLVRTHLIWQVNMLEDNPVGDMIFQQLELLNMDLYQFAEDMSLTLEEAKELTDGKKLIDGCTALKLERVLGIPADYWLYAAQERKSK